MRTIKYTSDGKCYVLAGRTVIAQSYLGSNGTEVRILQGLNRDATIRKIVEDCPEFARVNGIDPNYRPKLFAQ